MPGETASSSHIKYDSALRPPRPLDELAQAYHYRYLIFQLLRRDILTRYKRSVLGVFWTMLNPLGMMVVLTIAFSTVFGLENGYPAYVLSGLIAWNFFAQTTTAQTVNLLWGGGLLHRIYIPRTSFALAAVGAGIANFGFALLPMLLVMLVTGTPVQWTILFLPISVLVLSCFALGFGLLLATLAVIFPDVIEMYQIVLLAWMYLSPVVYPASILPETTRWIVQTFNPMYWMIQMVRLPLFYGRLPSFGEFLPALGLALGTLCLGWWIFTNNSDALSYQV